MQLLIGKGVRIMQEDKESKCLSTDNGIARYISVGTHRIFYFSTIDSTNSYALRNLQNISDKQVILAETQTRGHGRMSRSWISSSPQNIYMSIVLKPLPFSEHLSNLTQYTSVVICEVMDSYGVDAEVKWPNDVLVHGRKIAGILGESIFQGECFQGYVLGAGINLNMNQHNTDIIDQPSTALNLLTGFMVNREDFLRALLDRFFLGYEAFLEKGFTKIKEIYTARSSILGKSVTLVSSGFKISGTAAGFLDDGTLVLVTNQGEKKVFSAGDVSLSA
jgi:BirA family biotin operon repressor/biotin-[acetyl-CoA-carboxylase] ligase